jgi:hypothetical protein
MIIIKAQDGMVTESAKPTGLISNRLVVLEVRNQRSPSQSNSSSWSDTSNESLSAKPDGMLYDGKLLEKASRRCGTVLDQLTRLSAAIRKSGALFRFQKADSTLDIARYQDFIRHLNCLVLWSAYEQSLAGSLTARILDKTIEPSLLFWVRARLLDPSRLTSVQSRLIRANVRRHNRFIYAKSSKMDFGKSWPLNTPPWFTQQTSPVLLQKMHPFTGPNTTRNISSSMRGLGSPVLIEESSKSATELGSQIGILRARSTIVKSTVSQASATGMTLNYPHPPLIADDRQSFECPYCWQGLPVKYAKEGWRFVALVP